MRVLVCGGRYYRNWNAVYAALDRLSPEVTIQGGAHGADFYAREWARSNGVTSVTFSADWSRGKKAGPERNARMLKEGKPDYWLAFPGGPGTADMVRKLKAAGIPGEQIND
jgi:Protein of unknown function (DUF2493).